jgi:hypothetical protein
MPQLRATLQPALEQYLSHQKILTSPVATSTSINPEVKDSSLAVKEKEAQLLQKTKAIFNEPLPSTWKMYPSDKLSGKYIGHQVRFFTLSAGENVRAKSLCDELKKVGFDAELKSAKDKPSLVVDLTTSTPR